MLTEAAEADLRGIIRYTRKHWGDVQVRDYVADLEQGIGCLVKGEGAFKELDAPSGITHGEVRAPLCILPTA